MSLTTPKDDHEFDEETPLLPSVEVLPDLKPTRTPLPIAQISILLTVWFAESITSQSIGPYLNQVQCATSWPYLSVLKTVSAVERASGYQRRSAEGRVLHRYHSESCACLKSVYMD
jgi:hypothetical protein